MTLLAALVEASQRVGATGSRLSKVRELAALLRALAPDEVGISTLYLSGETPQGSIGLGYAALQEAAASAPAARASLAVADVDQALNGLALLRGAGSAARRSGATNGSTWAAAMVPRTRRTSSRPTFSALPRGTTPRSISRCLAGFRLASRSAI